MTPELLGTRELARTDPPKELLKLGGQALTDFNSRRSAARDRLAPLEAALFPPDPEAPGAA
jgi:hypothetical protein